MGELVDLVVAIIAGVVQGIVEWLPVSSQGNLSIVLTILGIEPAIALQLALFLQVGTTISAAVYYRDDLMVAIEDVPTWRPKTAFTGGNALTTFVIVACLMTGIVGIPLYLTVLDLASDLTGGLFVAIIGVLLIVTGVVQLAAESVDFAKKTRPTLLDAVIVGIFQGIAVLPGVSRSGVTVSVLLFSKHQAPSALRHSFILSIPAGLGAGVLTVLAAGGLPGISPAAAITALVVSAIVGYGVIGGLMRIVERIPFWLVCFGLGGLAVVGGLIVWLY